MKGNLALSELPEKRLLRRGEVREFLGVSEQVMSKMVAARTLVAVYLEGKGRAFFRRDEVLKLVEKQTTKGK